MQTKDQSLDRKTMRKRIYGMILPITVENILQLTAGFVSMAMIGRISAVAVGALGLSVRVTQIIWALFKGITTGSSVFVAQAYGAKDHHKLKSVVQQTLLSCVLLVIILQQLIYWNASALLRFFAPPANVLQSGVVYLRTVSWGLPFMVIMLIVAAVLQGMGNAKTPMQIAFFMNVINIIVSYMLIFGNFGFPMLGIRGAAIATVLGQFAGAAIGLYVLFRKSGILGHMRNKSFFTFNFSQIVSIFKVGAPTSAESIFWQIAAILLTKVILTFGAIAFAAHQLGLQAESISYMPAAGFGIAATTFVGQSLGAEDPSLAKLYLRETALGALVITIFTAGILIFFPSPVMHLLTNDMSVIKLGSLYLIIMGLVQIPQNLSGVLNGAMRGAGYTNVPMIVAAAGLWGIRVPFSLLLTYYYHYNITAIWIVMGIDLIFRFGLSFTLYKVKDIYSHSLVLKKA